MDKRIERVREYGTHPLRRIDFEIPILNVFWDRFVVAGPEIDVEVGAAI